MERDRRPLINDSDDDAEGVGCCGRFVNVLKANRLKSTIGFAFILLLLLTTIILVATVQHKKSTPVPVTTTEIPTTEPTDTTHSTITTTTTTTELPTEPSTEYTTEPTEAPETTQPPLTCGRKACFPWLPCGPKGLESECMCYWFLCVPRKPNKG